MAVYNFRELEGSLEKRRQMTAILHAVGMLPTEDINPEVFNPKAIDVTLTVNGCEIDYLKFWDSVMDQVYSTAQDMAERSITTEIVEIQTHLG